MIYKEYKFLIFSDLFRYTESTKLNTLIINLIRSGSEGLKYGFWMRTAKYTKNNTLLKYLIYPFVNIILKHYKYKFGISIPIKTKIGSGFYIGHFGGIVINSHAIIGKNCNISQGVTLGKSNRGKNKGFPIIGDNVYIGPGVKIVGAVKVGNNVAIGANAVVTKDIEDNSVVVGIPAKVISENGSNGYINRTNYKTIDYFINK